MTEVSPNLTRYGDAEKANFFSLAQALIQVSIQWYWVTVIYIRGGFRILFREGCSAQSAKGDATLRITKRKHWVFSNGGKFCLEVWVCTSYTPRIYP